MIQNLGTLPMKYFFKVMIKKYYKYFTFDLTLSLWGILNEKRYALKGLVFDKIIPNVKYL